METTDVVLSIFKSHRENVKVNVPSMTGIFSSELPMISRVF